MSVRTVKPARARVGRGRRAYLRWLAFATLGLVACRATNSGTFVPAAGVDSGIAVVSDRDEIVARRQARLRTYVRLRRYSYRVYNIHREIVRSYVYPYPVSVGDTISASWEVPDEIFMIHFIGEAWGGRPIEHKVIPWSLHLPPVAVEFPSGEHALTDRARRRLEVVTTKVAERVRLLTWMRAEIGDAVDPYLFVIGEPDAGDRSVEGVELALARANAIAVALREAGIRVRIHCGVSPEGAPPGRRAVIMSTEVPDPGPGIPERWQVCD